MNTRRCLVLLGLILGVPLAARAQTLTYRLAGADPGHFSTLRIDLASGRSSLRLVDEQGEHTTPVELDQVELRELRLRASQLPAPGYLPPVYPTNLRRTRLTLSSPKGERSWTHTACPQNPAARRLERLLLAAAERGRLAAALERPYAGRADLRLLEGHVVLASETVRLRLSTSAVAPVKREVELRVTPSERARCAELRGAELQLVVATTAEAHVFQLEELRAPPDHLYQGLVARVRWEGAAPQARVRVAGRELPLEGVALDLLAAVRSRRRPTEVLVDGMLQGEAGARRFRSLAVVVQLDEGEGAPGRARLLALEGAGALVVTARGLAGRAPLASVSFAASERRAEEASEAEESQ